MARWALINQKSGKVDLSNTFWSIPPGCDAKKGYVWSFREYISKIPSTTPNLNSSHLGIEATGRWEVVNKQLMFSLNIQGKKIQNLKTAIAEIEQSLGVIDLHPKLSLPDNLSTTWERIVYILDWIFGSKKAN